MAKVGSIGKKASVVAQENLPATPYQPTELEAKAIARVVNRRIGRAQLPSLKVHHVPKGWSQDCSHDYRP